MIQSNNRQHMPATLIMSPKAPRSSAIFKRESAATFGPRYMRTRQPITPPQHQARCRRSLARTRPNAVSHSARSPMLAVQVWNPARDVFTVWTTVAGARWELSGLSKLGC